MDKEKKVYHSFEDIFADDVFNLLEVKASTVAITADERLINSFQEINDFVREHNREPNKVNGFKERMLASRLEGVRTNIENQKKLSAFDEFNLLPELFDQVDDVAIEKVEKPKVIEVNSFEDILATDFLNLLNTDTEEQLGLFELNDALREHRDRDKTDFVAKRRPCKDFAKYEEKFKQVHQDLQTGKRKMIDFKAGTQQEGAYYVHKGVLFLLESFEKTREDSYKADGTRVRYDGRTRCIFENGTESNMLWRSVEKMLYDNGQAVTHLVEKANYELLQNAQLVNEDDIGTGYIYVLQSKSHKAAIRNIPNLVKIGFSTTDVQTRIKNAKNEPTYLMDEVHLVLEAACYNMNPQKFEQLIHTFFEEVCIVMEVHDNDGVAHKPREWFSVPLDVVEKVIDLIISEEIVNYRYDSKNLKLVSNGER
ncbi:GIY-YIG nuclease family protein [Myroides marinus]|uniref:GIY-YIG nuclease family protein n=1 Tax=Myroides marinus TaxID=703342 RepID=UPI002578EB31|nr:GIY-YIG nuclease family protein [Myroides marinus]MDM1378650.1 GIY-YIG nuclease family protein [Myroides marinus]MDM1385921.1 GIY-YIG nuclease family protein [Myroides marinus]MDM1393134.1 GIY-YIG nuclease family protein [Myroides marinus]